MATTFNLCGNDREDTEDIRVEVYHSAHTHPAMFSHQMDKDVDDKPFEVIVCMSETQMKELRDLINRALANEFI